VLAREGYSVLQAATDAGHRPHVRLSDELPRIEIDARNIRIWTRRSPAELTRAVTRCLTISG
jgi:hypothetical protein